MKKNIFNKILLVFGIIFIVVQTVLSFLGMQAIIRSNMFPDIYIIGIIALLCLFFLLAITMLFLRRARIFGIIISIIISILMGGAFYYFNITNEFLNNVTSSSSVEYKIDKIVAIVHIDDPVETLQGAMDYEFGILENIDRELVAQTIDEYTGIMGQTLSYNTYDGLSSMLDAFNSGEVQALIYNQAWNATLEELEVGFETKIKILHTSSIETKQEIIESTIEVTQDAFIVYLSGIDQFEPIATTGRSDVNMLAVVNPETHQILLVVTPRDYYLEFEHPDITDGSYYDKLTHAGNSGVQTSIKALENLYNISVEHYVRINFTSFIDVVDALGGVEVYSEQDFITSHFYIPVYEGYNYFNGDEALAFVRERFNLNEGDFQRGRNQQAMLTGIIEKAMSPAILTGYGNILNSLEGNMDTNFSSTEISELVKAQINDNTKWNIISVAALGYSSSEHCFSVGSYASVVLPNEESVADIQEKIATILNGGFVEEAITY